MNRVPVKLTRGEIVLPRHIAQNPQMRARLEAMNAEGLQARAMGGVVNYRRMGGAVYRQEGGATPVAAEKPKKQGFGEWANNNRAALGRMGASLVHIGQGDFGKASDALVAPAASEADSSKSKKAQALEASNAEVVEMAQEALKLVAPAAKAGDFVNGYLQGTPEEEASMKSKIDTQVAHFAATAAGLVAGAFDGTRRVRDEVRRKVAAEKYPDSYRAYVRLTMLANKMVLPVLASGALGVNPTDADVKLAKQAQFDIEQPSSTWAAQLQDLIARSGGVTETVAELAVETGNEDTVEEVAAGTTQVEIETTELEPTGLEGIEEIIETSENPSPQEPEVEEESVEPGSSRETAILVTNVPLSKGEVIVALKGRPREQWVTVVIDGLFKNKTITDTVGNILDYLEDK